MGRTRPLENGSHSEHETSLGVQDVQRLIDFVPLKVFWY